MNPILLDVSGYLAAPHLVGVPVEQRFGIEDDRLVAGRRITDLDARSGAR